jgi:hypothetical protein
MLGTDILAMAGGQRDSEYLSDVWVSFDRAQTWSEATSAAWGNAGRTGHGLIATSATRLVTLGGMDAQGTLSNKVFASVAAISADIGKVWVELTCTAAGSTKWTPRYTHGSAYLPTLERIVIGGGSASAGVLFNDVWGSDDGGSCWIQLAIAPWSARNSTQSSFIATTLAGEDALVMASGDMATTDVWRSSDGVSWSQISKASSSAIPPMRQHACLLAASSKLILAAGKSSSAVLSDVWTAPFFPLIKHSWTFVGASGTSVVDSVGSATAALDGDAAVMSTGVAMSGSGSTPRWRRRRSSRPR